MTVVARAPGRVNLIGDHTDYTGGAVLPLAINRWTTIRGRRIDGRLALVSDHEPEPLDVELPVTDPARIAPAWGRYPAAVAAELASIGLAGTSGSSNAGFWGTVETDLPVGSGLSSSAALEVATALALGAPYATPEECSALAQLCRRAEHRATGVPCGIMDQLTSLAGRVGHALLIDCTALTIQPVPIPGDVEIVVRFVAARTLVGSEYADRVAQCAAAETVIGPLRTASEGDWQQLVDPVLAGRARHVITENQRVHRLADALRHNDLVEAGSILVEGHESLRADFACSTPRMDAAVKALTSTPGVFGARMTGGGFGGCIVALTRPGVLAEDDSTWTVAAVDGASMTHGD